jgi:hypothetical protein
MTSTTSEFTSLILLMNITGLQKLPFGYLNLKFGNLLKISPLVLAARPLPKFFQGQKTRGWVTDSPREGTLFPVPIERCVVQ